VTALRLALVGLALLGGCQGSSASRLRSAPFEFRASPASVVEGGSLTLTLAPRGEAPGHADGPVDLYVSFERDSGRAWGYLAPSGGFTGTPAPYTRIAAGAPAPVTVRFASASPFGEYTFTTQFVRPGGTPSRAHYVFAPLVAKVSIRPAQREDDRVALFLGGLGVLSAGVVVLVLRLSRRREDATPSGG
jgi:hypothetical protein